MIDERTFDVYRARVAELERDMERAQDEIGALYRLSRTMTASFVLLVAVEAAIVIAKVML